MQIRLGDREEQLLRVLDRAACVLARQRQMSDLVGRADEPAEQCGPLDDRRVGLGVRDGRHVLHETDEELRAADRVELATRREIDLDALEAERLATFPDALDRGEHEPVLLA